jgi:thiamine-monophosphate kinase
LTLKDVGEFGLLRRLGLYDRAFPSGWVGPGDDAACVPAPACSLVLTSDLLVEGVHFRSTTTSARDLGYKAVAVNVSDVAAMGGRPLAFLVALAAPAETPVGWVEELYGGMAEAEQAFGCRLVGGDTSGGPTRVLSLTVLGEASDRGAVTRGGARPGDDVYVSGTLGDSALGLRLLEAGCVARTAPERFLASRHLRPSPRLALGAALGASGIARAMIDVSDGLLQDLGHVARASECGAEVWTERLPVSPELVAAAAAGETSPVDLALAGGEDYELLFTAKPFRRREVFRVAEGAGTRVRRIGRLVEGVGVQVLARGQPAALRDRGGFDHFARRR